MPTTDYTEFWAKTKAKAKEELFSASVSLFDPDVVKAFIDVLGYSHD